MDKHEIAKILDEIGLLLALKGENPFKTRAYHNAARAVENLEGDLKKYVLNETLEEVPGIGAHTAEKITILFTKGKLPYYEDLKKSFPTTLLELLSLPGLGVKKVKLLYEKLHIKTIDDLQKMCEAGKVATLPGFGPKTQETILNALKKQTSYGRRFLWWQAMKSAEPILEMLKKIKGVQAAEIAGSVRRKLETVGDLDFLVAASTSKPVMEAFTKYSGVVSVLAKGETRSSVRLKEGIQADIRVVSLKEFPFALLYFTGSKEHNIKLRERTNKKNWSLSEYGMVPLKKGKKPLLDISRKGLTEEDIYHALGLNYIPPELREDRGEIEMAEKRALPTLVEESDLRGAFHCHTTDSDGHNTLEEMVKAAEALKWEYIGISDHSKSSYQANGMSEERLFNQVARIDKLNAAKKFATHIFAGIECDILTDGKLDFTNAVLKELDFVIVSIHRSFQLSEKAMTARMIKAIENPYTTIVGHLTGRLLLRREPYAINIPKVIDACIANGKIIELNCHPERLDMDWRYWQKAAERGLKCSINPDAHATASLAFLKAGIAIARKGSLTKEDVFNTLPLNKVKAYLKESKCKV